MSIDFSSQALKMARRSCWVCVHRRSLFSRKRRERGHAKNRTGKTAAKILSCNNVDPISSGTFDLASNREASKERSTFASL